MCMRVRVRVRVRACAPPPASVRRGRVLVRARGKLNKITPVSLHNYYKIFFKLFK